MKTTPLLPFVRNPLKTPFQSLKIGLSIIALFAACSTHALALTLAVQVAGGSGGHIVVMPNDTHCVLDCIIETPDQTLVSLLALPDDAYRFQGWDGDCANTIGPLCTLQPNTLKPSTTLQLSARFVQTETPQVPTKALLLLHDKNENHVVWNEFAERYFNNRCPIVYGGVVLDADSFNADNQVYCYRIAFGYYDRLNHNATAKTPSSDLTVADEQWAFEIRATVLGLLNRHANLSLTLAAQQGAAVPAQSFLDTDTARRSHVTGLLVLKSSDGNSPGAEPLTKDIARLELAAEPGQTRTISEALVELTKSWWINR